MIDQKKFSDAVAGFLDHFGIGPQVHPGHYIGGAANYGLGAPADFLDAILVEDRLAGATIAHWHAHLDQAHAAITRNRQLRMITIMRNLFSMKLGGFNGVGALGNLHLVSVEVDRDHFAGAVCAHFKLKWSP